MHRVLCGPSISDDLDDMAAPCSVVNSPGRSGPLACEVYEPRIEELVDANYFLFGFHWA